MIAACGLLGAMVLLAQADWKTVDRPPMVDFSGLSNLKARSLLRLLRNHDCTCNCGMKVAECRVMDPTCSYSKGLAQAMGDALRAGKDENGAVAAAEATKWAHGPDTRILEDPVTIPTAGSPVRGAENAAVTLVEFSDFQCPYCYQAVQKLDAVLNAYPGKVKLIFKQFPLEDMHSQAALAAAAAIAAHQQGKFWQMHDALFARHKELSRPAILAAARAIGLDMKRFESDLDSAEVRKIVERDMADGDRAGVEGTPSVFINGRRYNGSLELAAIRKYIDEELKKSI